MQYSLLGYASEGLHYIFIPIGFRGDDGWKLTASLLSAFPAKEIAITNITMLGITFNVADGLSYLVMIMLMTPCIATCTVLKKEAG
jgi:ferrous iron transport protein B